MEGAGASTSGATTPVERPGLFHRLPIAGEPDSSAAVTSDGATTAASSGDHGSSWWPWGGGAAAAPPPAPPPPSPPPHALHAAWALLGAGVAIFALLLVSEGVRRFALLCCPGAHAACSLCGRWLTYWCCCCCGSGRRRGVVVAPTDAPPSTATTGGGGRAKGGATAKARAGGARGGRAGPRARPDTSLLLSPAVRRSDGAFCARCEGGAPPPGDGDGDGDGDGEYGDGDRSTSPTSPLMAHRGLRPPISARLPQWMRDGSESPGPAGEKGEKRAGAAAKGQEAYCASGGWTVHGGGGARDGIGAGAATPARRDRLRGAGDTPPRTTPPGCNCTGARGSSMGARVGDVSGKGANGKPPPLPLSSALPGEFDSRRPASSCRERRDRSGSPPPGGAGCAAQALADAPPGQSILFVRCQLDPRQPQPPLPGVPPDTGAAAASSSSSAAAAASVAAARAAPRSGALERARAARAARAAERSGQAAAAAARGIVPLQSVGVPLVTADPPKQTRAPSPPPAAMAASSSHAPAGAKPPEYQPLYPPQKAAVTRAPSPPPAKAPAAPPAKAAGLAKAGASSAKAPVINLNRALDAAAEAGGAVKSHVSGLFNGHSSFNGSTGGGGGGGNGRRKATPDTAPRTASASGALAAAGHASTTSGGGGPRGRTLGLGKCAMGKLKPAADERPATELVGSRGKADERPATERLKVGNKAQAQRAASPPPGGARAVAKAKMEAEAEARRAERRVPATSPLKLASKPTGGGASGGGGGGGGGRKGAGFAFSLQNCGSGAEGAENSAREQAAALGLPAQMQDEAASLRSMRRRLAPLVARVRLGAGHATSNANAATRLVTLRLAGFEGATNALPTKSELAWLANLATLRLPEILIWPGGLRVVFSEEVAIWPGEKTAVAHAAGHGLALGGPPTSPPAVSEADATALSNALEELHKRARAFFLDLLEFHLGYRLHCTVEASHDAASQVPLALPSVRNGGTASCAFAVGNHGGGGGCGGGSSAGGRSAAGPSSPGGGHDLAVPGGLHTAVQQQQNHAPLSTHLAASHARLAADHAACRAAAATAANHELASANAALLERLEGVQAQFDA